MRITKTLVQVAALLAATGCGSSTGTGAGGPGDGGHGDGSQEATVGCGGCGCGNTNPPTTHDVSVDQACALLDQDFSSFVYGSACQAICGGGLECELPSAFFMQVQALNPDAGLGYMPPPADGGDAGRMIVCPTSPATVTITCTEVCTGRRTEGCAGASVGERGRASMGERLATMAWLEAVSVFAFERLELELAAHGAGPELLRDARRARRDEVRHTAMTTRLARRKGGTPRLPDAPRADVAGRVRPLVEVAIENAVEGCVRETYGAVLGLVEARTSRDLEMGRVMKSISADECRHAELAWAVHAWAMARLPEGDRERVRTAMRGAVEQLADADARGATMLFEALPIAA